jgi:hypothetical protein
MKGQSHSQVFFALSLWNTVICQDRLGTGQTVRKATDSKPPPRFTFHVSRFTGDRRVELHDRAAAAPDQREQDGPGRKPDRDAPLPRSGCPQAVLRGV